MPKKRKRIWARLIKVVLFLAIHAGAAWIGVQAGRYVVQDTPNVHALETFLPSASTKVYAADGTLLTQFALERRTPIPIREMPQSLKDAVVAVEDSRFYSHKGIDLIGIARAALANFKAGRIVEGGSTLTQQLAKMLFLHPKQTYERKLKEALLAVQIEKNFTKDEILEFYLNQVNMGRGRYGAEAASQYYFAKPARALTLEEAALLAGIPQRPSANSPKRNPHRALGRRNHVLNRMAMKGYITQAEAWQASRKPIELAGRPMERRPAQSAAYFTEEVRRYLARKYGDETLYRGGLEVETTVDLELQQIAEQVIHEGLIARDRARGFRGDLRNVLEEGVSVEDYEDPHWGFPPVVGGHVWGLVTALTAQGARVRIGDWTALAGEAAVEWTKRPPHRVFRAGDLARFEVTGIDPDSRTLEVEFEQVPVEQAALVALEVRTGEVKAMVGGFDFELSEFNRATQAKRQTGSAIKPVYYAAALDYGWTPGTLLPDVPTTFVFPVTRQTYTPQNYYKTYNGLVTVRTALEKSLNVVSVQLLNSLGYQTAIQYARNMGIRAPLPPYPSMALGAADMTPMELTSAYTTFPNGGVHLDPYMVRKVYNRKGELLEENFGVPTRVMESSTAFQMVYLMMGVVRNGTGRGALKLGRPLGGKTGTTDDYSDAWFLGYTPSLAVGVWVGHEKKRSLGRKQTGAAAALPIWIDFMEKALEGKPEEQFHQPRSIVLMQIDRRTGKPRGPSCPESDVITEAFVRDNIPVETCGPVDHYRLRLPLCLQRYEMNRNMEFIVDDELTLIRMAESGLCPIQVDAASRHVLVYTGESGGVEIPYRILPRLGERFLPGAEDESALSSVLVVPVNLRAGEARLLTAASGAP